MRLLITLLACGTLVCVGCQQSIPRLNAPPHGSTDRAHPLQSTLVYMTDNALLTTMSVSDVHFVPNRAMLNTLGEERLRRLAQIMEVYGGTIRLNLSTEDQELKDQRAGKVMNYLCELGVDTTRDVLVEDLPGGTGMSSQEAILIKAHEGTYNPNKQASSESQ